MEVKQMKKNPRDRYRITRNRMVIQDEDTNQKILFCIDRKNMIVFRSMLEEDVPVINGLKCTSSQKRKRKKVLKSVLPEKNSENYFFVIEKIEPIDYFGDNFESEEWDWIYGYPRHPMGIGVRTKNETLNVVAEQKGNNENIEAILFNHEDEVNEVLAEAGENIERGMRLAELLKRPNINYEIFKKNNFIYKFFIRKKNKKNA